VPTQKELLAAHREQLDAAWHVTWPNGQWTLIHGKSVHHESAYWIAHQVRRSTSHTRYRARNAVYYSPSTGKTVTGDWVLYPSRWYGTPCRVEHHLSKALLLARLERAGVPGEIIDRVRDWD
jgi:hypothetical protein